MFDHLKNIIKTSNWKQFWSFLLFSVFDSCIFPSDRSSLLCLSSFINFFLNVPFSAGCEELASQFLSQEIDGQALLLLKEEHLMSTMNIKLGPALKICAHINNLKDWRLCKPAISEQRCLGTNREVRTGSDVELVLKWWQTCRWMYEVRFSFKRPTWGVVLLVVGLLTPDQFLKVAFHSCLVLNPCSKTLCLLSKHLKITFKQNKNEH